MNERIHSERVKIDIRDGMFVFYLGIISLEDGFSHFGLLFPMSERVLDLSVSGYESTKIILLC